VREGHLTRHVKLGIGGIREIEFIVQAFQVLRGARRCSCATATPCELSRRWSNQTLSVAEATTLADAYRFLRNVEHRLQMEWSCKRTRFPTKSTHSTDSRAVWNSTR